MAGNVFGMACGTRIMEHRRLRSHADNENFELHGRSPEESEKLKKKTALLELG